MADLMNLEMTESEKLKIEQSKKLKITQIEAIDTLKYLSGYAIHYQTESGREAVWELVSRGGLERLEAEIYHQKSISDGAVIFATTPEKDSVVLLKEYRVGAGRYVYMLPAGLADPDEDIAITAVREFKEETGLDFEPIHIQPPRYVSVGIVNEKVSIVFGYFSGEISKALQADNEDADILIVNREEAKRILETEEVSIRTALLLQDFFRLNTFFAK
jgi:ADP-ribose pyrophosphatase